MPLGLYRYFTAPDGRLLVIRLTPHELAAGGIHEHLKTMIFETPEGGWIGAAPMLIVQRLSWLSEADIEDAYWRME